MVPPSQNIAGNVEISQSNVDLSWFEAVLVIPKLNYGVNTDVCACFQVSGLLFTIAGFICGVMSVPFDHFKFAHGSIGLLVFLIGLLQVINGAL